MDSMSQPVSEQAMAIDNELSLAVTVALSLVGLAGLILAMLGMNNKIAAEDQPGLWVLMSFGLGSVLIGLLAILLGKFSASSQWAVQVPSALVGLFLIIAGFIEYDRMIGTQPRVAIVFWPGVLLSIAIGLVLFLKSLSTPDDDSPAWLLAGLFFMIVICIAQIIVHFHCILRRS